MPVPDQADPVEKESAWWFPISAEIGGKHVGAAWWWLRWVFVSERGRDRSGPPPPDCCIPMSCRFPLAFSLPSDPYRSRRTAEMPPPQDMRGGEEDTRRCHIRCRTKHLYEWPACGVPSTSSPPPPALLATASPHIAGRDREQQLLDGQAQRLQDHIRVEAMVRDRGGRGGVYSKPVTSVPSGPPDSSLHPSAVSHDGDSSSLSSQPCRWSRCRHSPP